MTCSCKTLTNEPCSIHSVENATNSFNSIISSNEGGNVYLKELEAGTDITIVDNGDYLTINSTGGGGGSVNSVDNIGTGVFLVENTDITNPKIKSLISTNGSVSINSTATEIDMEVNLPGTISNGYINNSLIGPLNPGINIAGVAVSGATSAYGVDVIVGIADAYFNGSTLGPLYPGFEVNSTNAGVNMTTGGGGEIILNVNPQTTLTGDVTGSGTNSFATTIANSAVSSAKIANAAVTSSKIGTSAVTYPKIQNVTASSLLGNPSVISASPSEITLGTNLSFAGSVLNATTSGGGTTSIGYNVKPVTVPDNASESNFPNVIIPANTITAVGDIIRFSCAGTSTWATGASTVWFRSRISGNLDTFELSYAPFSFTPAGSSRYNWSIEGELIVTSLVAGVAKMISNINSKISLNNTAASATSIVVQDTDHDADLSSTGEQVTADIDLYCSLATNILGNVTATSLYTKVWKE